MGAWWNRCGDEIDLLALGQEGNVAVEIKHRDLTPPEVRGILSALEKKIPLVKGLSGPTRLGFVCQTVQEKETLREEGYFIRELADFGFAQ